MKHDKHLVNITAKYSFTNIRMNFLFIFKIYRIHPNFKKNTTNYFTKVN